MRQREGWFYEYLIQGIYGGELKEQHKLHNGLLERIIEPDLSCENFDRDAKGVGPNGHIKLKDKQIAGYSILWTGKYSKQKEMTLEIFRHRIRNIQVDFKEENIGSLFRELSKSTNFMISLPFRVVFDIYASGKCSRQKENFSPSCYNPRYTHSHGSYSRIDSGPLNALLAYPEETLKYFNVEMNGLKIIKSKFPERVKINKFEISSFPVLIIKNLNSNIWEEKFFSILNQSEKLLPEEFNLYVGNYIQEIENPEPEETEENKKFIPPSVPEEDIPF